VILYSIAGLGALALMRMGLPGLREHGVALLLTGAWFAQMAYPATWSNNLYLVYPALYGFALLGSALGSRAAAVLQPTLAGLGLDRTLSGGIAAVLVAVACLGDYREAFHSTYYPWNVVTRVDPLASARLVNQARREGDWILADIVHTLYYAGEGTPFGVAYWSPGNDAPMIQAIESGRYDFVVFTYTPSVGVVRAIERSRYDHVGPAVWAKRR
jgi:hypothetical protein